jgi:hypothetical protein
MLCLEIVEKNVILLHKNPSSLQAQKKGKKKPNKRKKKKKAINVKRTWTWKIPLIEIT